MRIGVGSERRGKIEAVRRGTMPFFLDADIASCNVQSGVGDEPMGLDEIFQGATNRAKQVLELDARADLGFGLEAGSVKIGERIIDVGLVCAAGRNGMRGYGASQGIFLPHVVVEGIRGGSELAVVISAVYGTNTVNDHDCSSVLTEGLLPVEKFYRQPVELACLDYMQQIA